MTRGEFAENLLRKFAEVENFKSIRDIDDLSRLEQWLIEKMFAGATIIRQDDPFSNLKMLQKATSGASWQMYYVKKRDRYVLILFNLRVSFEDRDPFEAIKAAENYILKERVKNEGMPKFTLFKQE